MEEKRKQKLREEEVRAGPQPAPQFTLEQEQRDRSIQLSWGVCASGTDTRLEDGL